MPKSLDESICTVFHPGVGANFAQAEWYIGHGLLHNVHINAHEPQESVYSSVDTLWNGVKNVLAIADDDAPPRPMLKWWRVSLAGAPDVQMFLKNFREAKEIHSHDHQKKKFVLFGVSRGAATILMAIPEMTEEERALIALVLLESPFDSGLEVLRKNYPWTWPFVCAAMNTCGSFRCRQKTPLQAVAEFPLTIPIAFISSFGDQMVPLPRTATLVDALRKRGHEEVHVLRFVRGQHAGFLALQSNARKYSEFLQPLYEKQFHSLNNNNK